MYWLVLSAKYLMQDLTPSQTDIWSPQPPGCSSSRPNYENSSRYPYAPVRYIHLETSTFKCPGHARMPLGPNRGSIRKSGLQPLLSRQLVQCSSSFSFNLHCIMQYCFAPGVQTILWACRVRCCKKCMVHE